MPRTFVPQKRNANRHTPRGLRLLEQSVQRDGFIDAQTAAADGEIISGSARLELSAEKFADVEPIIVHSTGDRPVIVVRDDIPNAEDPRARRLSVAANKIAQVDFDPDGDLLREWAGEDKAIREMWSDADWQELTGEAPPVRDAEPQTDRAAELLEKWQVKTGDLWQIGEHRLICGDCTDAAVVERVMDGERADFSVTDPPYNVKVLAENDDMPMDEFIAWCKLWAEFMPPAFVLTVGIKNLLIWDSILGVPQWIIAWIKRNGQGLTTLGGTNKWDAVLCYGVKRDGGLDVIEVNNDYSEGIKSEGGHLTAKPPELWQALINRFGGDVCYEPFSGSGTSLIACQNLSRRCRAVEISPAYCAVALERMSQAFPGIDIKRLE